VFKKFLKKSLKGSGYLFILSGINTKIHSQKRIKNMKKLLFVLALGAFVAACGGGTTTSSTDSSTNVTPAPDTTSAMPADTTHADTTHADTTHK